MTFKYRVLSVLKKPDLVELGKHFDLPVRANMTVQDLAKHLAGSKRASLDKLLQLFPRDSLKDACEAIGLPRDGKEKQVRVQRFWKLPVAGGMVPRKPPPRSRRPRIRRRPTSTRRFPPSHGPTWEPSPALGRARGPDRAD